MRGTGAASAINLSLTITDDSLSTLVGTIFAYGQTGTGKTHTMEGSCTDSGKGIIPRAFEQIFSTIDWSSEQQFLIRASFLEVYNEDIRDLLSKVRLTKLTHRLQQQHNFLGVTALVCCWMLTYLAVSAEP